MSTRIPEGFVLVRRAPGVALALLEAADRIKADRQAGVRTVMGGYHVAKDIADEYIKTVAPVEDGEEIGSAPDTQALVDAQAAGNGPVESSAAVVNNADAGEAAHTADTDPTAGLSGEGEVHSSEGAPDNTERTSGDFPDGAPEASWTHEQIDAWAAAQSPAITFEAGAKKSEKLDQISK